MFIALATVFGLGYLYKRFNNIDASLPLSATMKSIPIFLLGLAS